MIMMHTFLLGNTNRQCCYHGIGVLHLLLPCQREDQSITNSKILINIKNKVTDNDKKKLGLPFITGFCPKRT